MVKTWTVSLFKSSTTSLTFFRTEFWRIRQLIEDTAYGVRSGKRPLESVEEYAHTAFGIVLVDSVTGLSP